MQKNIRTDFGFKTINIGSITIYTGKIRIKAAIGFLQHKLRYGEPLGTHCESPKDPQALADITAQSASKLQCYTQCNN